MTHLTIMQVIEAAKKRGQEKAKLTKSMIILDVKPWDDTTGTQGRLKAAAPWVASLF